jgi:hypothetical protein
LKNLIVPVMAIGKLPVLLSPLRHRRIGPTGHSLPESMAT